MENNKRPNQAKRVLEFMRENGSITSRQAFLELSVQDLPKRICELQAMGFLVKKATESGTNKFGESVRSKRYSLIEEFDEKTE